MRCHRTGKVFTKLERLTLEAKSREIFGVRSRYKTLAERMRISIDAMDEQMNGLMDLNAQRRQDLEDYFNELRSQNQDQRTDERTPEETNADNRGSGSQESGQREGDAGSSAPGSPDGGWESVDVRGSEVRSEQLAQGNGVESSDGSSTEASSVVDERGE